MLLPEMKLELDFEQDWNMESSSALNNGTQTLMYAHCISQGVKTWPLCTRWCFVAVRTYNNMPVLISYAFVIIEISDGSLQAAL